ncbi:MAG: phosphotransferase [Clostridiales bacterium]|nr:phosphotransferase [Clostridiales bacterium]
MKPIPDEVRAALCRRIGVDDGALSFLGGGRGDSDGIVYRTGCGRAIKLLGFDGDGGEALAALCERMRFAAHLGAWDVPAGRPLALPDGALYASVERPDATYVAYLMPLLPGRCPENAELTPALVAAWGRLTGRSHRATKSFARQYAPPGELSHQSEMRFFRGWCRDPGGKAAWDALAARVDALPRDIDNYGFIHNDNHSRNILVEGEQVSLIDFDCANAQFFIQDVLTPMQGLLFEVGGFFEPARDRDRLTGFLDAFLSGYERENHLADAEIARLDLFLSYRRLLLFTCMQDWLDTQPEIRSGFRALIADPPAPFAGCLRA